MPVSIVEKGRFSVAVERCGEEMREVGREGETPRRRQREARRTVKEEKGEERKK